jgi:predicted acylesterase/phospholipase RssA
MKPHLPIDDDALRKPRTALVLSAGAMFGAYQAGVWRVLHSRFAPDVVIGASVGSLNGWAIAGGMPPEDLMDRWLHLEPAASFGLRWPRSLRSGCLDSSYLAEWIRELHARLQPQCEYGAVLTRLRPFRPELFTTPDITWQHLAASCAMPFLYPHYQLNGCTYTDGGLMQALPLWTAAKMGCERVVAVNIVPQVPIPGAKVARAVMQSLSRHPFHDYCSSDGGIELVMIEPKDRLGDLSDFLIWKKANAERWMEQGARDAEAALQLHADFFGNAQG